jgi:diaminopimelate epimerase
VKFSKYHGTGNDFVMVEDLADRLRPAAEMIAALCDRHRGVGADGLIRIAPAAGADFFMDYYNANGEVAEMCGNGIRCLAKYVFDRGLTRALEIDVETRAGTKHLVIEADGGVVLSVTVDMGEPAFDRKSIGMTGDATATFLQQPLEVGGRTYEAAALSMGNPHCVLFLPLGEGPEGLAALDVAGLGRSVEMRSDLFPDRTNVEFVTVAGGTINVRVWERGSGETMACGTGACAALVASALTGRTGRDAELRFPGGALGVSWRDDGHVSLTGPAVCVFDGEVAEDWLEGAAAR